MHIHVCARMYGVTFFHISKKCSKNPSVIFLFGLVENYTSIMKLDAPLHVLNTCQLIKYDVDFLTESPTIYSYCPSIYNH